MAARNDVTGDLLISKSNNKNFDKNYSKAFGNNRAKGGSWVYDPVTRKLVPVTIKKANKSAAVHVEFDEFISPIDGTLIDSRGKLTKHNNLHGVTNDLDSLKEKKERQLAMQRGEVGTKQDRVNDLVESYDRITQNQHLYK